MAVKLHRCSWLWNKVRGHPCWRVQSALDEQGIAYQVVPGPLSRAKRNDLERISGQRKYPTIEFEDGSVYREESKQMAETIRAGRLDTKRGSAPVGTGASPDAASSARAAAGPAGRTARRPRLHLSRERRRR